jgi:PTS system mannose-specific IIA component
MVHIVVLSHGPLAQALLTTAHGLVGPQSNLLALGLGHDESPAAYGARLRSTVAALPAGGVLLLCDLRGGTPHRLALAQANQEGAGRECAVVSDTTLGLLCEALVRREGAHTLHDLVAHLSRVAGEPPEIWKPGDGALF